MATRPIAKQKACLISLDTIDSLQPESIGWNATKASRARNVTCVCGKSRLKFYVLPKQRGLPRRVRSSSSHRWKVASGSRRGKGRRACMTQRTRF